MAGTNEHSDRPVETVMALHFQRHAKKRRARMKLTIAALFLLLFSAVAFAQNPNPVPPAPSANSALAPTQPVATATPPPASAAPASEQATIYFYRPKRYEGYALKPSVFVDETKAGSMHNGSSVKVSVPPGNHRIYSTDKSTGLDLNAKAGETYYVRIDIQTGFWKGHGGVTLVDPQQGKYEVGQLPHKGAEQ
jgi:Protein of unknown function (DUF2846)